MGKVTFNVRYFVPPPEGEEKKGYLLEDKTVRIICFVKKKDYFCMTK